MLEDPWHFIVDAALCGYFSHFFFILLLSLHFLKSGREGNEGDEQE